MGYIYELATTAPAFLAPAHYVAHPPERAGEPTTISFGPDRQQHFVLWEPAEVKHELPIIYFHGGAYVFGEAESMADAADVYNAQGYRFCSVGFRCAPRFKFPRMINDAFEGTKAAIAHMEQNGIPCKRLIIGGTSAGGHAAMLMCYARWLQEAFRFPAERIAGCVSVAGVADAADMLVNPFPTFAAWKTQVDLPTESDTREDMLAAIKPYSPLDIVKEEIQQGTVPNVPLFVVHGRADTLSPYASQAKFVEAIRQANGHDAVEFLTLEGYRWQHMHTTVTMHKHAIEESTTLQALFAWLDKRT